MKNINLKKIINEALAEDKVRHDITSQLLIPKNHTSKAVILMKEEGVICGLNLAKAAFKTIDPSVQFKSKFKDGRRVKKGTVIIQLKGRTRSLLAGERVALNFLGYLSGIATNTQQYVNAVNSYKSKILATRKTTPGNRAIEKYAVTVGGGLTHRMDLSDMVLIKDNHRFVYKKYIPLNEAIDRFKRKNRKAIEVEVDTLSELKIALKSNPDFILLDNMTNQELKKAVRIVKTKKGYRPLLEASGGVTLKNIRHIAKTGVDRISIGALTHHQSWINFSMDFTN